jgi:putative ABC transport system ATP-binding protein
MGPSGSGKSTTLYQLGLLDEPTSGQIIIDGKDVSKLSEEERGLFRLDKIGYIFQNYELLSELTALENVYLPVMESISKEEYIKRANEILNDLGLEDRKDHYSGELSGGEQQRVSIARALIKNPKIILADEPTANLDSVSGKQILELLKFLNKKYNKTILVVNHEEDFRKYFHKIITLKDGKLLKIEKKRKFS